MEHKTNSTPRPVRRSLARLAENVTTWRKLRGLTQAQLAERSDVARGTLRRIETGDGGVSTENLMRVLRALGLLDAIPRATDPFESDIGRLRADEQLPMRVRPRQLNGTSGA